MQSFSIQKYFRRLLIGSLTACLVWGCKQTPDTLLVLHTSDETGLEFSNTIPESDTLNIFTYDYIYNGGGVGVADFNHDGLQDIFFTGNVTPNRLFLNKGDLKFTDVTNEAHVNVSGRWNSGVVVVDINNDGWSDLYVCATRYPDSLKRRNMLFLNKGPNENKVPVFEEVAEQYGIADTGYSHMASFFDYDRDGDLDLYVLTNKQAEGVSTNYRPKVNDGSSITNDRLYRNNGNGSFTNVTLEAGIIYEGYGLGLAISDFNNDGWPDIYVSNDFMTNDLLYINNQNGTFSNQSAKWISHTSQSSMGSDASDFNNDGLTDMVTMDMLPETNARKKTSINNKSYLNYINNEQYGYEYQYMRNMLHLNNGLGSGTRFSEIGQMAGVFQTEWSWSAQFLDFDNDGHKDLFITNGFPKDITDKDFVAYREDVGAFVSYMQLLDSVPVVRIPNYVFKNNGDLTFKDASQEWGVVQPSFSNGAAYADFDNDGDLDYVINNINEEALFYENKARQQGAGGNHYLRLKLVGPSSNRDAIGARAELYSDGGHLQMQENYVARGYLSSTEGTLHFGLGHTDKIDSLRIIWPDGKCQRWDPMLIDTVYTLTYSPEKFVNPITKPAARKQFSEVSKSTQLVFKHEEIDRIDYNLQRTLPHKFSQAGPGIAVGDITGDGLEDMVIGGSVGHYFTMFVQSKDGTFKRDDFAPPSPKKKEEDQGLLLFDFDGDHDLDLYIVSGGIESPPDSIDYVDRLYRNNGKGKFSLDDKVLPKDNSSGFCIRAADFDGDNDLDLLIGGRVVPGSYPLPGKSCLLQNNNGVYQDVTESVFPELRNIGMVNDALFTDFDNDNKPDLVVVGEFMPVVFAKNTGGKFQRIEKSGAEKNIGWWNSIVGGDFDRDGDVDYVAGNLGLNNSFQVADSLPLCVFAKDFDKNGSVDAVMACFIKRSLTDGEKDLYPVHFWDEINGQSPRFRQQFLSYKQYSRATINDIFTKEEISDALILKANHLQSSYIENLGNGTFKMTPLPQAVQIAPVNGMVVDDVDQDGNLDVVLVGNDWGNEVFIGRYDAFTGAVLRGDGKGSFTVIPSSESGFLVDGDAKALARLSTPGRDLYLGTQNLNNLMVYAREGTTAFRFKPEANDVAAELDYSDGQKQKVEFYYGAGYISQSTRTLNVPAGVSKLVVRNSKGEERTIVVTPQ